MQRAFTFAVLLFAIASTSNAAAQAPAVRHNTWTSGTPLPVPVQFTQTGVINGLIYVVGGFNSNGIVGNNQIYNPATNTWSSGAPMPDPTGYGTSAVVKNILYVIGGTSQSANQETGAVWAYDPTTDTWTQKSPMPTARGGTGTAVEKNIIYVIGGNGNDESRLTNVEAYNPAKDKWTEKAPLLIGRSEPSVGLLKASIGGKVVQTIVAADGFTPSGGALSFKTTGSLTVMRVPSPGTVSRNPARRAAARVAGCPPGHSRCRRHLRDQSPRPNHGFRRGAGPRLAQFHSGHLLAPAVFAGVGESFLDDAVDGVFQGRERGGRRRAAVERDFRGLLAPLLVDQWAIGGVTMPGLVEDGGPHAG